MGSPLDFLRMLQHELSFTTANRQLRLRVAKSGEDDAGAQLLVQRLWGSETICGGIEYRAACLSHTPKLELKAFIGLPVEIQIVTDRGQLRRVCGIVTEARAGDFDGGLAVYHLVVRDALAIMERRVNSRIFRFQNELEIIQVLFDEWRHSNAVLAGAFDYELDPLFDMRNYPPREQTMQYNESDAAFIRRLLARRGISHYIRPGRSRHSPVDPAYDPTPAHTLVLFSDPRSLPENEADTVRYHRDDASDSRDVITSWIGARKLQSGSLTRHSWDYKNPQGAAFMTASARGSADQGPHGNQLAATLDDYLIEVPHSANDVEDHWRLGQLSMARHDYETKCFHGLCTVRDFCAASHFTLEGHPEIDTHPASEREFAITGIELTARNNLPKDLDECGERLLARERGQIMPDVEHTGLVQVRFTAVRRGVPIVPHFDPRTDLPHPQMQSAIVVGPPGEEVHCDAQGRVKIRFPGMRPADHKHAHGSGASDTPADSAWVRVASGWAGNGPGSQQQCGTLGLPRVGTEVLVSFLGGDPDKPIIVSQLFNQIGTPPALSRMGELPGNRYLAGMRSREVGGQRGGQVRFDDTRGQISTQLASDHGKSELNLGWLTHPRANGAGEPRGEGAELRSDDAVAIRGGKGVLVTAEASPDALGTQLGRAGMIGVTELVRSIADQLGKLAAHHAGDDDTSHLAELVDFLKRWDQGSNVSPDGAGGAAMLGMSAPDGIVAVSPNNVLIGSERRVDVTSVADTAVSAGGNVLVRAARGLSAFVHALGIKLIAGRGDVNVEAHDGAINIKAARSIRLASMEDVYIEARNVHIVSHGAQTDWGNGTITQQSSGQHVIKASAVVRTGPGGGSPTTFNFSGSAMRADERVVLRREQTGEPVRNRRYTAHLDNGETVDGVTDDRGRTSLLVGQMPSILNIEFHPE
jgi:type VI secretion system secreted protein VgrG